MEGSKLSPSDPPAGLHFLAPKAKEVDHVFVVTSPWKNVEEIKNHHVEGVESSLAGKTPVPAAVAANDVDESNQHKSKKKKGSASNTNLSTQRRREWTEAEHNLFINGYEEFGRKWKTISRVYVRTKTTTQVATHARAYFKKLAAAQATGHGDVVGEYLDLDNFPSIYE